VDTKDIARYATLHAKALADASTLTPDERREYTNLVGAFQAFSHTATQGAARVGIKVADTKQQDQFIKLTDRLIYNVEGILRYHGNVVCGNAVAELNTLAQELGIPQQSSAMGWYNALTNMSGLMSGAAQRGISSGRDRITWGKELTKHAKAAGEPQSAPFNVAEFTGK
jgi:hypothetical protein